MDVGIVDHPEIENWFRIKREKKKNLWKILKVKYVCMYLSIYLISPGRYLAAAFWCEQARLGLRILQ